MTVFFECISHCIGSAVESFHFFALAYERSIALYPILIMIVP
jgi:hypothetical protein